MIERRVDRQLLPGRGAGQHLEKYGRSASLGITFSMPIIAMCTLGSARGQAGVAFVGDQHDRAGFGDGEVRAGDADVGRGELLPQLLAGEGGQRLALGGQRLARDGG